jgi:hypothetical protein
LEDISQAAQPLAVDLRESEEMAVENAAAASRVGDFRVCMNGLKGGSDA